MDWYLLLCLLSSLSYPLPISSPTPHTEAGPKARHYLQTGKLKRPGRNFQNPYR